MNKSKKKGILNVTLPIAFVAVTFMLLAYFLFLMAFYDDYMMDSIGDAALIRTQSGAEAIKSEYRQSAHELHVASERLGEAATVEDVVAALSSYEFSRSYLYIRIYSGGLWYNIDGAVFPSLESDEIESYAAQGITANTDPYYNLNEQSWVISFYRSVQGNGANFGIMSTISLDDLVDEVYNRTGNGLKTSGYYSCIAYADGSIIGGAGKEIFETSIGNNIFTNIYNIASDKSVSDNVERIMASDESGIYTFTSDGMEYIVAFSYAQGMSGRAVVVSIYSLSSIMRGEYILINRLWGIAVAITLVLILGVLYMLAAQKRHRLELNRIENIDPLLGCNTYNKFASEAQKILSSGRGANFALAYIDIRKFKYISEHFGNDVSENTLRFVCKIIDSCMRDNETFGHIAGDRFVLILRYRDRSELENRITLINALSGNYEEVKRYNYSLNLSIGVYCIDPDKDESIDQMTENANIAQRSNLQKPLEAFDIYTEDERAKYLREAAIETRMEGALERGEFRMFLQPKYNIENDRIDGAEALVRWSSEEAGVYISPDEFIHIFEVNGFISKLDRYMFIEACKLLSSSTGKGERVVPISVNVSMVTAMKSDFLDFYISNKKKYNIADGFITVEFTESFALENYELIRKIVSTLRSNGIHCSIDDFGSGFSSYNTLKELRMDELKLDKSFILAGFNKERDNILLSTVIKLGRDFGMKVTQEGVEEQSDLDRLKEFGCNVIQGYIYSRPLDKIEYLNFISGNTSFESVKRRMTKGYGNAVK